MHLKLMVILATLLFSASLAAEASAQSNYKIKSGDVLSIEVLEDPSMNRQALVLPDGSISFPIVGAVSARGRTVEQVQQSLANGLTSNFVAEPNVFVSVGTVAEPKRRSGGNRTAAPVTIDAYIMGEVASPGKKQIKPGSTLIQLLAEAGGLTSFAAKKRIELHRTDKKSGQDQIFLYSYTGTANGPRIAGSTELKEGDVVIVPQRMLFE